MRRSRPRQKETTSILFRMLFFLIMLQLLLLLFVFRVIPCILCDLFDLCYPDSAHADTPLSRHPPHATTQLGWMKAP